MADIHEIKGKLKKQTYLIHMNVYCEKQKTMLHQP